LNLKKNVIEDYQIAKLNEVLEANKIIQVKASRALLLHELFVSKLSNAVKVDRTEEAQQALAEVKKGRSKNLGY